MFLFGETIQKYRRHVNGEGNVKLGSYGAGVRKGLYSELSLEPGLQGSDGQAEMSQGGIFLAEEEQKGRRGEDQKRANHQAVRGLECSLTK